MRKMICAMILSVMMLTNVIASAQEAEASAINVEVVQTENEEAKGIENAEKSATVQTEEAKIAENKAAEETVPPKTEEPPEVAPTSEPKAKPSEPPQEAESSEKSNESTAEDEKNDSTDKAMEEGIGDLDNSSGDEPKQTAGAESSEHIETPLEEAGGQSNVVETIDELEIPLGDTREPEAAELVDAEEEEPERTQARIQFTVAWKVNVSDDSHFFEGDEIILKADSEQGFDGARLQWQVAVKFPTDLEDDEEEWCDINGATSASHQFAVMAKMMDWRWRLQVKQPDGTVEYSQELRLPILVEAAAQEEMEEGETAIDVFPTPDGGAPASIETTPTPLPQSTITFSADVPMDEITLDTEITLFGEISDPWDNMQLQWQYMTPEDVGTWHSVQGATGATYHYVLDETNCFYVWRLLVTVVPEEAEMMEESEHEELQVFFDDSSAEPEVQAEIERVAPESTPLQDKIAQEDVARESAEEPAQTTEQKVTESPEEQIEETAQEAFPQENGE